MNKKHTKYYIVGTIPKYNRKMVETYDDNYYQYCND